jgi:hypothetical protein
MPAKVTLPSRQEMEEQWAEDREHVQLAVEQGGLPTATEVEQVETELRDAVDRVSSLAWRVEGILKDDGRDIPAITLEQIGLVAVLTESIETYAQELAEVAQRLRKCVLSLDAVRLEQ